MKVEHTSSDFEFQLISFENPVYRDKAGVQIFRYISIKPRPNSIIGKSDSLPHYFNYTFLDFLTTKEAKRLEMWTAALFRQAATGNTELLRKAAIDIPQQQKKKGPTKMLSAMIVAPTPTKTHAAAGEPSASTMTFAVSHYPFKNHYRITLSSIARKEVPIF